jgi:hypothetical protein
MPYLFVVDLDLSTDEYKMNWSEREARVQEYFRLPFMIS